MGSVFLGEHVLIGRKVAVKVLDPEIAKEPEVVSRFFVEARAVNEIGHPNIVEVTDLGTHEGSPFIVMEYLQGETMEARLARRKKLTEEECVGIARQVASALGAAHERGMVHRDVKPANIILREHPDYPDFVKVLDFGIAKLIGSSQVRRHQTQVGMLLGTPAFMSPEQCLGDSNLDHRSDIYSLGVIIFLCLSGRLPFADEAVGRLIVAHVHEPAPKLSDVEPSVSPAMSAVVERAMAKKPEARFQSMRELRQALERTLGDSSFPRSFTPVAPVLPVAPASEGSGSSSAATTTAVGMRQPTLVNGPPSASTEALARLVEQGVQQWAAQAEPELPAMPGVYVHALELLQNPGFSFSTVASLLRQDARLVTHVVRRANSDGVVGRGVAITPEQALGRLGSVGLRAAVIELAVRRVIEARHDRLDEELRRPWQHAMAGAIAAETLARLLGKVDAAKDAYTVALMRDIGLTLAALRLFEIEALVQGGRSLRRLSPRAWLPMIQPLHRTVTGHLMKQWKMSPELIRAIEEPEAIDGSAGWSLANLRRVGGALADREGFYLRREGLAEAGTLIENAIRTLALTDPIARRSVDRLKEAVRLRE